MSSNFSFLQKYWPDFAKIMEFAENYAYTDPASSKTKSGLFIELMVREILRYEKLQEPFDNTHYSRTKLLKDYGLLPYDVNQWINQIRKKRNDSAHENIANAQEALSVLGFTYHVAVWFMKTYGDGNFKGEKFIPPEKPQYKPDYTILVQNQERVIEEQAVQLATKEDEIAEKNAEIERMNAEIKRLIEEREKLQVVTPQSSLTKQERQKASAEAIAGTKLTEDETRKLIEFAGENGKIQKQDIDKLCIKKIESVIFDLTDNLGQKKIKEAMEVLYNLITSKEPIQKILITLYNHFKKLYFVKLAIANNKDIATSLNLKANQMFLVNKYKAQAKGFKTSELRKIVQELQDLDYRYKIGLIDLNVGLEAILCAYCS